MVKKNGKDESKKAAAPAEENTAQASGLPLFFKSPRALDTARHAKAAVRPVVDFQFAKDTNSILINAIEFIEAAKHYPIVFTNGEMPLPAAVVGLEQSNYFVQKDGSWKEGYYVPAYVRQYPFVFFERPEEQKFYLCIDEAAPHYSEKAVEGATPLYEGDKPSALTNNALQFCTAFYNHYHITKNLCADLQKHNLLMPYQSEAKLVTGKKLSLSGFQMIDEKAFNALPSEVFLEFRQKGWLAFIYFALASTLNWKRLVDLAATDITNTKAA